jgi:hypothetical protein
MSITRVAARDVVKLRPMVGNSVCIALLFCEVYMCERCGEGDCSPELPLERCKYIKPCVASLHTGIKCPHCNKMQLFAGDYRGQIITCPICANSVEVF